MTVTEIPNIETFTGSIPAGADLMVYEKGNPEGDNAFILHGFDEVGIFDSSFKNPTYGFMTDEKS